MLTFSTISNNANNDAVLLPASHFIHAPYSSSFPGFFSFLEIISVSVYIQTTTTIVITRCKAKPVGSPPAYPPRRLLIMLLIGPGSPASIESGNGLPAPSIATALLVVRRRRRPSECHVNYKARNGGQICPQNWLPRQRPLRDRKYKFTTFICGQSSTDPANVVKICAVDVWIIGLTEIAKIFKKK